MLVCPGARELVVELFFAGQGEERPRARDHDFGVACQFCEIHWLGDVQSFLEKRACMRDRQPGRLWSRAIAESGDFARSGRRTFNLFLESDASVFLSRGDR